MALAFDAKAVTTAHTAGATSLDNTTLTIGAGATCLLVSLLFQEVFAVPSSISVRWDSAGTNQLMTLITERQSNDVNGHVQLYGLVNPTSGNKTLHAAWTTSVPAVLDAISFTGGVTTSVATAFVRAATNAANSGAPTLSLTGAAGNISACAYDDAAGGSPTTGLTATSSSLWFTNSSELRLSTRGATAPSAGTVTWTGAPSTLEWCIAGVDVVAAPVSGAGTVAGAGGIIGPAKQWMIGSTQRW